MCQDDALVGNDGLGHNQIHGSHAGGTTSGTSSGTQPVGTIPQLADYLVNGYWQSNGALAHHWASNTVTVNLTGLTAAEQTIARAALALWHDVANITFVETTGTANIKFIDTGNMVASTSASWSSNGSMLSSTVDISSNWVTNYGTSLGSYSYQTYIHEIGHALGLGHQGPYNGSGTYGVDNVYANDTWQYSVMSYFGESNYGGASYRFISTPQMADIYAISSIYGASATTRTGDTVYGFNSNAGTTYNFGSYGSTPALTIYDSGGTDTLDCSGYSQNQVINLTGGSFSNIGGLVANIGIYTTSVIENAIGGSGADTITGNGAANRITGRGGNDSIDGGGASDTVVYQGASTSYSWVQNLNGSWTVTDLSSAFHEGADTLFNVEFLAFSDKVVTLTATPDVAPVAVDDTAVTQAGIAVDVAVLANDSDSDGGPQPLAVSGTPTALHGLITVNSDGTLHYTPTVGYVGADTITYVVTDGQLTDTGQVAVTVNPADPSTNHAPVAVDDTASTKEDTAVNIAVLTNDSDPDGNPISVSGTPTALHGTVTVNNDGTLRYTPNANWNGTDTITYLITDGSLTDTGAVSVAVSAVNDAPTAVNNAYSIARNGTLKVTTASSGVLGNDSDVDGNTLTAILGTKPSHGTLTLNADGTFSYKPARNFTGTDTFTYKASDGVTTSTATVTIKVGTGAIGDVTAEQSLDQDSVWAPHDTGWNHGLFESDHHQWQGGHAGHGDWLM